MTWSRIDVVDAKKLGEFAEMLRTEGPCCSKDVRLAGLVDEMTGDHASALFVFEPVEPNKKLNVGFNWNPTLSAWRGQYAAFDSGTTPREAATEILAQSRRWMETEKIPCFYVVVIARDEPLAMQEFFAAFPDAWLATGAGASHRTYRATEYIRVFFHGLDSSVVGGTEPSPELLAYLEAMVKEA